MWTDGLSGGRAVYGHVITKFSRMGRLLHFLTHGAPLARFARESFAIIHSSKELVIYQYVLLRQQFHFQTIVGKLLKMSEYSGNSISNEGPRDWHNLFAIPRFRYIEVVISLHLFYYYLGSKNSSLYRGLRSMEVRYIEIPLD